MDVILHTGAHRTATTTLQRCLADNRRALSAAEVAVWGPKVTRGGIFQGLMGPVGAVLPWHIARAEKRVALRLEALRQSGMRTLFVSEENMLGKLSCVVEETSLYPAVGRRVAAFAQGFAGHRLTIGLGLRAYDEWWASAIAFRVMRGGPMPQTRLREYMVTQPRRWRHVISDIAEALPEARLVVWTHEAMAARPEAVIRALSGQCLPEPSVCPRHNAGPTETELLSYLEDCEVAGDGMRFRSGRFMPFEAHERTALRAQYDEDLAWLATGADGRADWIDEPGAWITGRTGHGRGIPDDGARRRLA